MSTRSTPGAPSHTPHISRTLLPGDPKQGPRNTDDPRVFALADRMDDLVVQMRRERVDLGTITAETSAAFRATEAAYWLVCQDPDEPLPHAEQAQATAALAAYSGARTTLSPMLQVNPSSHRRSASSDVSEDAVPLPA